MQKPAFLLYRVPQRALSTYRQEFYKEPTIIVKPCGAGGLRVVYGLGFRLRGLGFHGALQGFCGCLLILFLRRIPHTYTHMHTYIHTYTHMYM